MHREKRKELRLKSHANGSVIIIVLWTAVLLTVLVTAMASKVRLSAKTALHNQEASQQWADMMGTVSRAEMEIMLAYMNDPIDYEPERSDEGEVREDRYRFNGRPLELHYSASEDFVVRIYDHAGKINLNRIPRRNMQLLIEKRLGGTFEADPEEVQQYLQAWTDWTDLNDLADIYGAEEEYYQSLDPPYSPRNNPELDTVEEILQIRGFAELFEGVNLDAAFTVYGNNRTVNLNLATREAMQLLPGLNDELIENILAYRELEDINDRTEIGEIVPFENLQELSSWVTNATSDYYSVFVYPRIELDDIQLAELSGEDPFFNPDPVSQGYMEIIEVRGFNQLPTVYKIDPYGYLPDTGPPRVFEEDFLFNR
ncbi:MAG: type II secretion system protein GspK [Gammaproteobacteria bacterium]